VEISSAWEAIRENIKFSAKESLDYFEAMVRRRMIKILDQMKQAKLQWLQYTSEINGDNLNNEGREAS
jgi:hypothetical protein